MFDKTKLQSEWDIAHFNKLHEIKPLLGISQTTRRYGVCWIGH